MSNDDLLAIKELAQQCYAFSHGLVEITSDQKERDYLRARDSFFEWCIHNVPDLIDELVELREELDRLEENSIELTFT